MCFLLPAVPCLLIFVSFETILYIYIYSVSGLVKVQITQDTVMVLTMYTLNCAVLDYYAASGGNLLQSFLENLSIAHLMYNAHPKLFRHSI